MINFRDVVRFDTSRFHNFQPTEISEYTVNSYTCESFLKKEKSLFITDISVVEDQIGAEPNIPVFPNPSSGSFFAHLPPEEGTISITDINGSIVFQTLKMHTERQVQISLPSTIPTGVYFIHFKSTKYHLTQKILLQY